MRLFAVVFTFVAFTTYTLFVMAGNGVLGFLSLAANDPWGMQLLLDLGVMLVLFSIWLLRDAKARGLPGWPYVLATMTMGSIGALGYLVHRELAARKSPAHVAGVA